MAACFTTNNAKGTTMNKLPTDLEILECIYVTYADCFREYSKGEPSRSCRIYVPIDINRIAETLETDPYILHGRLYHHLDPKYALPQGDGKVHLFAGIEKDPHCIHYPYLAALVSEKNLEYRKNVWALSLSFLSLVVSIVAVIIAAQTK